MITFDPLWKTLKEKNISQYKLLNEYNFSRGTLDNLKHNRSITLTTLNQLCEMQPSFQKTYRHPHNGQVEYSHP